MPRHGHDYDSARILHSKGLSIRQIHEETGIPYEALLKYAQRHQWTSARTKIVQRVSDNVQAQLVERSSGHLLKISGLADKVIDKLIAQDLATLKLNDLQTLATVADTFDKVARRAYGLDADNSSRPRVTVNVAVLDQEASRQRSALAREYVDVETIDTTSVEQT